MATDFFARQDAARKTTSTLVILFALGVAGTILAAHLIVSTALYFYLLPRDTGDAFRNGEYSRRFIDVVTDPSIIVFATAGTLLVVLGGALYKFEQLSRGGPAVAESLGGRLLDQNTRTLQERQLLNIVEEMAIASGTPVPPVYLLAKEDGINAFAAGFTPNDAVIGVTRGAVEALTRDELQGVIGHEFSHILNGDMRLNLQLIGILHGILLLGLLGYYTLRVLTYSDTRGSRSSKGKGGAIAVVFSIAIGLIVIGFAGTFFGNLIKAAVARQRERLADASGVQFTRNPAGLAGALKKIGGAYSGSRITSPNGAEASHLFFARAVAGFSGLFSTHPPLAERIRTLDPNWDGEFTHVDALPPHVPEAMSDDARTPFEPMMSDPIVLNDSTVLTGRAPDAPLVLGLHQAVERIGRPQAAHLDYAERALKVIPPLIAASAREPHGAMAVVYALLIDRRPGFREMQFTRVRNLQLPGVHDAVVQMAPLADRLDIRLRLPIIELALPSLKRLTQAQYQRFKDGLDALIRADEQVDLFEWSVRRIVVGALEASRAPAEIAQVRYQTIDAVRDASNTLVGAATRVGEQPLGNLDDALAALSQSAPDVKKQVVEAVATAINADGVVSPIEAELLRAISGALNCPMPPVIV